MRDLLREEQFVRTDKSDVINTFYRPGWRIPAVVYRNKTYDDLSHIGILVMHSDEDYLSFSAGEELACRGFTVMCANVSNKFGDLDQKIRDANVCMNYLRDLPGIDTVILLGHSGGGTLMSAYQSIAEHGPSVFQKDGMLKKCPDDLAGITPGDGLLLLDSNWGNAAMRLFSMDPALTDESDSHISDPSLDLFNPENGFKKGGSTYSDEFVSRFFKGQHERNTRLNEFVLSRISALENGKGSFDDDEPLFIAGTEQGFFNNKLYAQDIRFMSGTRQCRDLIHADGSITNEIVYSLRQPENDNSYSCSFSEGAIVTTVRSYLSSFAIRTDEDYHFDENGVYGIDWDSNYNCTTGNIRHVTVPLLVMGMTGGWEFASSETIFENAGSADKELLYVEGADHFFRPSRHLEKEPGQFGDTIALTYNHIAEWILKRF